MATSNYHEPALLKETLALLAPRPGGLVVDGTIGGGGHAEAILEASGPDGRLIGLDGDEEALAEARVRLERFRGRFELRRASFRDLESLCVELGPADAVLLDLGVSSHQLNAPGRGFRFSSDSSQETPLDMRMDRRLDTTAAGLLANTSEVELADLFRRYGEIPGARRLARSIVAARRRSPLCTASDLLQVIRSARIGRGRRHDPATLVFQALRIAVNDELHALEEGLEGALRGLRPGGRLVVISYHSLEDRIVKHFLRTEARDCVCPPGLPVCVCGHLARVRLLTRRPVRPGEEEIARNPRSRSARLRAAERRVEAA